MKLFKTKKKRSKKSKSLRSFKRLDRRYVLPLLVLVIGIGGYLVYRSYAGTTLVSCQRFENSCLTESRQSTIVRLYYTILGRAPSQEDISYWTGRMLGYNGSKLNAAQVAEAIVNSPEFKNKHGQLSNEAFVSTVYQQANGVSASTQTFKTTADQLNSRKLARGTYLVQLANSSNTKQALLNKVALALAVKTSSLCLSRNTGNVDIANTQKTPYRNVTLPQSSVINATTAKWDGKKTDGSAITWATIVDGRDGGCWYGGRFFGSWDDRSPNVTWENPYHHSAGMVIRSSNFMVEGLRVNNQGDGISAEGGAKNFRIRNVYLSDIHDDCVQNDGFNSGLVEGSLFDGCYSGFSAASDRGSGATNTWRFENNLVRMKPFHTIYKPEKYLARGCKIPSHHGLFKGWSATNPGPKVVLKNNIFRADEDSCVGTLDIPANMNLTECSNNTFVWLGKGPFPYKLPDCIKVTTNKAVWDNAVAKWKTDHPTIGW